jgi:hypothetical protein
MLTMFDSVTVSEIPANAQAVAGYVGGKWPTFAELRTKFPHAYKLSIAINAGEDAECLDIENGDATPAQAPGWFHRQRARGVKKPVFYTSLSEANAVMAALSRAGIARHEYRLWTGHHTDSPHICGPSEGLIGHADCTQYINHALGRNLDASLCASGFFPASPISRPHHIGGVRELKLSSPEMRGEDVRHLQKVLNERLAHYQSRARVKINGIYDRETVHAVAGVARAMGLEHFEGSPAVVGLIEHPHLRNPEQLVREHQRAGARKKATELAHSVGAHGLLPAILAHAHAHLGVHESPDGSNWGKPFPADWEREFGFDSGVSWCGCFAGAMVNLAGGHVDSRVAFCPYIEADARARTNGFDLWKPNHNEGVKPGWLVLYNWNGGSEPEHVGIVKEIHGDHLVAIEGNTGGTNPSDGGMVAVEQRPYHFTVGYARPRL